MPSPATLCSLDPDGASGYCTLESASHMQALGEGAGHTPLSPLLEHAQLPEAKDVLLFMLSPF